MTRFSRRRLLKALGVSPGLLPLLDADVTRAATSPKRLIMIAVPNGVRPSYWPSGTETNWTIADNAPLAPLAPHQKDLLFLGGLKIQSAVDGRKGNSLGGHAALPFLFTGSQGVPGPRISDGVTLSAGNPSVDVFVAQELTKRQVRPFRMELMPLVPFRHSEGNNDGYLSFKGPPIGGTIPNVPSQRHDPVALFNDLFGGGAGDATLAKLRAQRKSIFDLVGGYLSTMNRHLGTEDRRRLEIHAEGLRTLERQLAPGDPACGKPPLPTGTSLDTNVNNANPQIPAIIRAQIDIVVGAMSCDLSRVASLLWQDSGNIRWVWSWLGAEFTKPGRDFANGGENMGLRNDHEIAHRDGEPEFEPLANRRCRWYLEQVAYLIDRLKGTPDAGGGTLFDSTLIVFANMQRTGGGHHTDNLPWILAGSARGYFKTGRYLPWPSGRMGENIPHNRVLASIANAMDVPVPHYGHAEYGGELSLLRG